MWQFKRKPTVAANNMDHMLAVTIAKTDIRRVYPGMFTVDGIIWVVVNGGIMSERGTFAPLSETAIMMLVAHLLTRPEVVKH